MFGTAKQNPSVGHRGSAAERLTRLVATVVRHQMIHGDLFECVIRSARLAQRKYETLAAAVGVIQFVTDDDRRRIVERPESSARSPSPAEPHLIDLVARVGINNRHNPLGDRIQTIA